MSARTRTPAETLRAAAALLRERAKNATPGPWKYCRLDGSTQPVMAEVFAGPRDEHGYLTGCVAEWAEEADGVRLSHEDGDWLEVAHPGIGAPLAAALSLAAEAADGKGDEIPAWAAYLVVVAQVVLGESDTAVTP